jgi:hypothetical protein
VLGWCADFFRFWWGLVYWNARKSWFRLRRGRSACPCQNPSDSGRAFETQCDACMHWSRQARFKRVCPLLVDTPQGLRCSAHTAEVRPFWGRCLGYYGAAAGVFYAIGVLSVFTFLRTIGYPISIVHVGLPPLWYRVGQARGWFFEDRAEKAFAANRTQEGLLYLTNSFEFDPTNYRVGLRLAKYYQVSQPARSDEIFEKLLREHPDKRHATAQEWFRALLSRGAFPRIATLARAELLADAQGSAVWMRALLFSTRRAHDDQPLRALLADPRLAGTDWRRVLEIELALRGGREAEARRALAAAWPRPAVATPAYKFGLLYRVRTLLALHEPLAALDLLEAHAGDVENDDHVALRLDALAAAGATVVYQREISSHLSSRSPLLATVTVLSAHLIRYPNAAIWDQVVGKAIRDRLPLDTENAGGWFSLLAAAGMLEDKTRLHALTLKLRDASATPFIALGAVEMFFRGETPDRRLTTILPLLPLPLEVTYALVERFPETAAPAPARAAGPSSTHAQTSTASTPAPLAPPAAPNVETTVPASPLPSDAAPPAEARAPAAAPKK